MATIKNITEPFRIGEYPYCIDVTKILDYHSDYGLLCNMFEHYDVSDGKEPRIRIIRNHQDKKTIHILIQKWDEQWEKLPDEVKNGTVLYDSCNYTKNKD